MDDTEKIVLYFFLHRCESAQARDIQRWARLSDSRMEAALERCENTVFQLQPSHDNGQVITLVKGPVTEKIQKKYGDIVGMKPGRKKEEEPGGHT